MSENATKVTEKKVSKVNLEEVSAQVEKHFAKNKVVTVIADSRLENPTAFTYEEYRFVHFYNKGTTKDMFQLYLGKTATFIIRTTVAEFLGEDIAVKPIEKKVKGEKKVIHIEVKCPIDTVNEVAEKIIEAYGKRDENTPKPEPKKKATKKSKKVDTE